jgi:transcriptional regulator with XRE-family HTH domain
MDANTNRVANFLALYRELCDANLHLPQRGMLTLFAEKVGISRVYLSHVKCGRKQIGAAAARKIEAGCGKTVGWLDQSHGDADPRDSAERALIQQILSIYRTAPPNVKNRIIDAIREAAAPAKGG